VTAEQVCSRVQPGSIVLMHDATSLREFCDKQQSAAATRLIVDRLRGDGYRFVSLQDLLGLQPYATDGVTAHTPV
jgi:peptidoglycan/xylan/chitin deacetylase (PgdA/CDA1 family)